MRIFLSYRREDSSAWAGRLWDVLAARVGEENVFQDVVAVRPGQDFTAAIEGALGNSDVVLAVIGPTWLTAASADGLRHLNDDRDHVRNELSAALRLCGFVVPVLVGRATMPNPDQLPDDLRSLALLQAVRLSDDTWSRDVEGLLQAIGVESRSRFARRGIATAVVLAVLVGGAAIGTVLLQPDDSDGSTADEGSTTPTGAGPSTTFDPFVPLPQCTAPVVEGSNVLVASGAAELGPANAPVGRTGVADGRYRAQDDGWDVHLALDYTALTDGSQSQYWWLYQLTTGGMTFEPFCFSEIGGQEPACCGEVSEVLVGFDVTADPGAGAALLIDVDDNRGRIELAPG